MRGRNVDSHRLYWVVVARDWWLKVNSREDWGEIIEEMALPKRCVNNEIALKKINFRFLDKYAKVYFHDGPPTKRRTTKSYIIGATSRPQTLTSRRRSFSRMNLDSEPKKNLCHFRSRITCSKSNSFARASSTPCSGCASRIGNSPFRHFTFQPGNVDHPSRINGQLRQDCPD
ncbi:uncharacterized protein LOC128092567 [Culex pipiens pallens]|uniref:uncharacterized protein LOC128092567 n=1 Tax=Culex pipiens pallens TaxID=42434 RepID=UPI0022A9FF51|nr:uncharacterized protein LOC128092567 [Culex pipiens pallens]